MLSYLYTSDYEGGGKQWEGGFCNTRLYAIAEKYDIPLLKRLARARFTEWAESNWSHRDFPTVVKEVYESTPSSDLGLRDIVSHLCGQHVKELANKDEFLNLADLFGELGLGVLKSVLKDTEEAKKVLLEKRDKALTSVGALYRKLDLAHDKLAELTARMRSAESNCDRFAEHLRGAGHSLDKVCHKCGYKKGLS
jgi:hypothetical protein